MSAFDGVQIHQIVKYTRFLEDALICNCCRSQALEPIAYLHNDRYSELVWRRFAGSLFLCCLGPPRKVLCKTREFTVKRPSRFSDCAGVPTVLALMIFFSVITSRPIAAPVIGVENTGSGGAHLTRYPKIRSTHAGVFYQQSLWLSQAPKFLHALHC